MSKKFYILWVGANPPAHVDDVCDWEHAEGWIAYNTLIGRNVVIAARGADADRVHEMADILKLAAVLVHPEKLDLNTNRPRWILTHDVPSTGFLTVPHGTTLYASATMSDDEFMRQVAKES